MDLRKALEKGADAQKVSTAMPSKADMIAAFGEQSVEEIKDEAGNVTEVRFYYIRPWMTDEQKEANWAKFNEMVAKARGIQIEQSNRKDQERQDMDVEAVDPHGNRVHLSGQRMEDRVAAKPGWRPVLRRAPQKRWAYRNGVLVRQ